MADNSIVQVMRNEGNNDLVRLERFGDDGVHSIRGANDVSGGGDRCWTRWSSKCFSRKVATLE
jgi:hypothetical protein